MSHTTGVASAKRAAQPSDSLWPVAWTLLLAVCACLAGCRNASSPPDTHTKLYKLQGKVVSVDAAADTVTIDHRAIPGLMEAMTMPYKIDAPGVLSELHPGDQINARLKARETPDGPTDFRLDEIVVTSQADPNALPLVQYHVPKPGDVVPDFHLTDQSGHPFSLKQLHGKVVLLTFIYTRCPLADFCPRMSQNFAEIDKGLATDPQAYARSHLLSISFDPKYDTPAVLRSYGGAHTGRFTEEDFRHWQFAVPSVAELPKVEQYFDLGVTPARAGDPTVLTHSLSTVLIGRDGKVIAWYPDNTWKPAEVLAQVVQATR